MKTSNESILRRLHKSGDFARFNAETTRLRNRILRHEEKKRRVAREALLVASLETLFDVDLDSL